MKKKDREARCDQIIQDILEKSDSKNYLWLIDFLTMICYSTGKIYFVKWGTVIQNQYVAL